MWHLLALPFILAGFLISGAMAAVGATLFLAFLIPLMLLALVFRVGFFFLKVGLVVVLLVIVLVALV